ncbi:hypothetical protein ACN28C_10935 [Plantactinospora sp. WMMC1484]|uniref:hypothetical protein n=1 Tax=Plantactinospora sp. WMMC1484 TaxID=3404122 RepID=UPI003BF583D6
MSRQELAEAVNTYLWEKHRQRAALDRTYIGKLERGQHRWPQLLYRKAFRAVLGATTDKEVGFHIARTSPPPPRQPKAEGGEVTVAVSLQESFPGSQELRLPELPDTLSTFMDDSAGRNTSDGNEPTPLLVTRRQSLLIFAMATIAAGVGLGGPTAGPRRRIGVNDLSRVNAVISLYRSMDSEFGGGVLADDVDQVAQAASGLLDHTVPETLLPQLFTVLANARYLAAWTAFDATRHVDAQRHFMAAERYAMESGDRRLLAHVRYGQARQLQHLRQNRDALHTLRLAHHQLDATPGILAVLYGAEAASHAALDDPKEARRALSRSSEAFGAVEPTNEPEWLGFLDKGELLAQYGRVYRDMARNDRDYGDDAVRWVTEAITSFGPQNVRSTVLNQVGLCSALFLAGAPDLAIKAGNTAQQLATTVTSPRVIDRIANLRRDATNHLRRSDVADFIHSLPKLSDQPRSSSP